VLAIVKSEVACGISIHRGQGKGRVESSEARDLVRRRSYRKGDDLDMRPEYDFSKGVRGKYYKKFTKGTNVVVIDPDVAKVFRSSEQVNEILRTIGRIAKQAKIKTT
jgi:hypothetical protein